MDSVVGIDAGGLRGKKTRTAEVEYPSFVRT